MKKMIIAVVVLGCTLGAVAGPHHRGPGRGPGGFHRPPPPPVRHHPHHGSCWGRGGRNFWPGFVGGVIGGAVTRAVVDPAPVVVTTPTVVTMPTVVTTPVVTQTVVAQPVTTVQNVWVPGRYVDQVQANGTVLRVWQPGHYEQTTIVQ